MKFAHPLWPKPMLEQKFGNKFSVKNAIFNTLLNYAYSVACLHKLGHTIILYADKTGAEMLDFIPYDRVVILDIPEDNPYHFASQSKFYSLQQMDLDEILIDGDLFIETDFICNEIQEKSKDVDMLYSFMETNEDIQESILKNDPTYFDRLIPKFHDTLFTLPTSESIAYPNSSLMLFNSQDLKDKHIQQYFYHMNTMRDVDWGYTWPDLITEQYFLLEVAKGYSIKPYLDDYKNVDELHKGFVHLGSAKTRFQNHVRQKLYFADKELFKKTMKRFDKIMKTL